MTYPTERYLLELSRRGHDALLEKVRGTVRIDVAREGETDHWLLTVARGDLRVARDAGPADAVVSGRQTCWDGLVSGSARALDAWLRNELTVEGRFELLTVLDRLMPGYPGARHPRDVVREGGRAA
ncbi:SCP2 sterol-binding domain-containing protein [Rhizomonospora bruguierae]|uniref:SCP2 sterol-binding domain-containing protein n=1 Tax=Rhizomonospora bruguierae TaxID=1581705 RepID=UPI001BD1477E|nr:SCP2 sterol-binding domain-containing protein [Micromonospora sp. NBRC 107566]